MALSYHRRGRAKLFYSLNQGSPPWRVWTTERHSSTHSNDFDGVFFINYVSVETFDFSLKCKVYTRCRSSTNWKIQTFMFPSGGMSFGGLRFYAVETTVTNLLAIQLKLRESYLMMRPYSVSCHANLAPMSCHLSRPC